MYSPTTRLLTLLELLQSHRHLSGAEIARRLEVDRRTVRRYIVMLQDMGIPVEAERGPYGAYQLRRGYKLPPLMFTDSEAVALTIALLAIRELGFPVAVAAVEGALAKTERVMPEKLFQQARALQEAITFNVTLPPFSLRDDLIVNLSSAVQQRQQVFLRYQAFSGDESERAFDPYGVVYYEGYWYTVGYCHLRHALRTFRLDRVRALEPLPTAFTRPADFDALGHVVQALATMPGKEQIVVWLGTSLEQAQVALASLMGVFEAVEDGVLFRRSATQLGWVAQMLLRLDFPVRIQQNQALRDELRSLAARARRILDDEPPDEHRSPEA